MKFLNTNIFAICDCENHYPLEAMYYCNECEKLLCRNCITVKVNNYFCCNCSAYYSQIDAVNSSFRCKNCKVCPSCNQILEMTLLKNKTVCSYTCENCSWVIKYKLLDTSSDYIEKRMNFNDILVSHARYLSEIYDNCIPHRKEKDILSETSFNSKYQQRLKYRGSIFKKNPPFKSDAFDLSQFLKKSFSSFETTNDKNCTPTTSSSNKKLCFGETLQKHLEHLNCREQFYPYQQMINETDISIFKSHFNYTLSFNLNEIDSSDKSILKPVPMSLNCRSTHLCCYCQQNILYMPDPTISKINEQNYSQATVYFPYITGGRKISDSEVSLTFRNLSNINYTLLVNTIDFEEEEEEFYDCDALKVLCSVNESVDVKLHSASIDKIKIKVQMQALSDETKQNLKRREIYFLIKL